MIGRPKVLLILFLFSGTTAFSQQLSNQVLVPAAGLATSTTINYSQTIGETAVDVISGSGFTLTQGFQQPAMKITDITPTGTGVDVYPNPASDYIYVKLFGAEARRYRIEIINIAGTIVSSVTMDFITDYNIVQRFDISDLTFGFYFVRVSSFDAKINRVFKIEKM